MKLSKLGWILFGSIYLIGGAFFIWLFFQFQIPPTPSGFISRELLAKILLIIMTLGFFPFGCLMIGFAFDPEMNKQ